MIEQSSGKLRFHPKTVVPEVPEGMKLVKFHGAPALIPAEEEGDIRFGNSQFTERQVNALIELESRRRMREVLENLDELIYPAQYVVCRIFEAHPEYFKV